MRRGGVPPYVAVAVGVASGYYIFNEPLRRRAEELKAEQAREQSTTEAQATVSSGTDSGESK
eukprot:CAMPEP_0177751198 /NCGR_PEP_ID=MMETSP0491_2-20121128/242_1 /TAXON_ID=63592 /ORGANISM="Tetraselmis chuii, Strain PLY429" /LENGTH=61 /DNA_ID=CAMNT_0019266287 /DNA_START=80 /DNA_END=265 /DNA_ORIENTATION=+